MNNIYTFIISIFFSIIFTLIIKKVAVFFNITDKPDIDRKIHKSPIPLLGGVAIFLAFYLVLFFLQKELLVGNLNIHHWLGFFLGGLVLIIGGILDDKFNLSPSQQFIFPVLAIIIVLLSGIEIEKITNPFGGFVYLNNFQFSIFNMVTVVALSDIFLFLWLLGMMYTTKLLDGIDGLVTGVAAIGSFIIFLFTMTEKYYQPDVGLAALVLSACCFGFLIFNFHPAKIFLGEGGSLFLGYALGVLAVISGGKIAIALLVMGIPILDVAWTIIRRLRERKNPFKFADRKHLHFRLLDMGLGQRKTVLVYYLISSVFGVSAIFLQSKGKVLAVFLLMCLMVMFVYYSNYLEKNAAKKA